jgi:HAD superfamily hydrolase (TIGR01509 family)
MPAIQPVRAALFDLDGTLVDSETQTDEAIAAVAARHGVAGFALPHSETRGRTWIHVAQAMQARTGMKVAARDLAAELLEYWTRATADAKPIPGAPEALRAAARRLKLGVVSSSPRTIIDAFIDRLGVADCIDPRGRVGGDAVRHGKPDPEGLLLAAGAIGVDPGETLVCEDSRAGLLAARAAGMRSLFIRCCASEIPHNTRLATASCTDYRALPPGFWDGLADGRLDLAGRSYT